MDADDITDAQDIGEHTIHPQPATAGAGRTSLHQHRDSTVRHRLLNVPAAIARHARRTTIRYKSARPFADLLKRAISNLCARPDP